MICTNTEYILPKHKLRIKKLFYIRFEINKKGGGGSVNIVKLIFNPLLPRKKKIVELKIHSHSYLFWEKKNSKYYYTIEFKSKNKKVFKHSLNMPMRLVHNTLAIAARMVHRLYIVLPQEPFNYDESTSTLSNKSFPVHFQSNHTCSWNMINVFDRLWSMDNFMQTKTNYKSATLW